MKKIFLLLLILLGINSTTFSQFDKPILQLGIGISEPFDELKGKNYLTNSYYQNAYLTLIDSNLYKSHYGAQTGFNIFGAAKINFDKYSIVRGVGFISFANFNTFQSKKSGNQLYVNPNNPNDYFTAPQQYNYSFNALGFGLGLEIAPTSFTKVFSPFFGANVSFNSFTSSLERNPNSYDTVRFKASGFRIGVNFNAGIEFKFAKNMGLALGVKYDLGNLLLKSNTNASTGDFYEWGRNNADLNDEEGPYRSSLPNYLSNNFPGTYQGQQKKINWGTAYIAFNLYLSTNKTTTGKTPPKK